MTHSRKSHNERISIILIRFHNFPNLLRGFKAIHYRHHTVHKDQTIRTTFAQDSLVENLDRFHPTTSSSALDQKDVFYKILQSLRIKVIVIHYEYKWLITELANIHSITEVWILILCYLVNIFHLETVYRHRCI